MKPGRNCRVALVAGLTLSASVPGHAAKASAACDGTRDIRLVNGKIATMAPDQRVVSSVNIKNGRIVGVGSHGDGRSTPCTQTIDLHGRLAVPGLIDNHIHIVALGRRPGFDTPFDSAASIAEIQQLIRRSAEQAPKGEFITAIGGWTAEQLVEKRLPTPAELDAASPDHPVLIVTNTARRGIANSAGRTLLEPRNVAFKADGEIASNADVLRAVSILKNAMTMEQLKRNTSHAMQWAAGVGLTTVSDMGSNTFTGTDKDSIGAYDPARGYAPLFALADEGRQIVRYRLNLISWDDTPELPMLKARLDNSFRRFGSDMLRTNCIGESIWTFYGPGGMNSGTLAPAYGEAAKMVAERGDCYEQHAIGLKANKAIVDVWEKLNAKIPIGPLRWRIAHAIDIDKPTVERLKALGAGIGLVATIKMPYRMILDSGIRTGASSDARNTFPGSPWVGIQYMVTGRNNAGELDNAGQTISRMEALRLYTADNGWFLWDEDKLGSIEIGKLGDLAVLSDDYLDPKKVPDDRIGRLTSVLTIVDGKIVHRKGL